jgi:hypothetical protein
MAFSWSVCTLQQRQCLELKDFLPPQTQRPVDARASSRRAPVDVLLTLFGILHLPTHCKYGRWDYPATGQRPRGRAHHGERVTRENAFAPQKHEGWPGRAARVAQWQTQPGNPGCLRASSGRLKRLSRARDG